MTKSTDLQMEVARVGKKNRHSKKEVREVLKQLCECGSGYVKMTYMGPDKKRHNYEGVVTVPNSRKIEVPVYGRGQLLPIGENDIFRIQLLCLKDGEGGSATLY